MRGLVVDDEKLLVKGIKFNLENDGYQVDAAFDGAQALAMFRTQKYDIIILDLMLPEIGGLEVCRKIRETSNVPVITHIFPRNGLFPRNPMRSFAISGSVPDFPASLYASYAKRPSRFSQK